MRVKVSVVIFWFMVTMFSLFFVLAEVAGITHVNSYMEEFIKVCDCPPGRGGRRA